MQKQLKNLFIPQKENGFKPNFLERFSMGVMLVLVLFSFAIANIQSLLWIGSEWMVSTILPAVIVDLTNEERGVEVLGTLRRNITLDEAAQMKAEHMASNSYFAHYSPDGVSPWYWFDQVAYDYLHAGENLAVHFTDSSDVIKAWMDSPSHRANILNGDYTEIGVGTAQGEYQGFPTVYVVQLFGTPRAAALTTVAGATTEPETDTLTLETTGEANPVSDSEETAVAQASFETIETKPTETEPEETTVIKETEVITEESTVVYSDLATTSRAGVPASTEATPPSDENIYTPQVTRETNVFERSATQPSLWLEVVYAVLAGIVVVALILSILVEWRRQHPVQIAYALGMLLIMGVLYEVHTLLLSGVTIV